MARPLEVIGSAHRRLVHQRRVLKLAEALTPMIEPGWKVLDVGCGDGVLASLIAERVERLDISGFDVLVRGSTAIPVAEFDGRVLPAADDSADAVMMVDVLHHTDDPTVLLREAARVARHAVILKDHRTARLLAYPTLRFMDWVGNRAHGVALPYNYWPERRWREAWSEIGLDAERFETPEEERRKFVQRLGELGVDKWDRSLRICELFCGRGNGLAAWLEMGFKNLEGLDLSADLVRDYDGPAKICVGDARELPYEDSSFDAIAVQGGLHHLTLMDDLDRTLAEIQRVLKPDGRLLIVEPWLTTFLKIVHAACGSRLCRRVWGRLDALATMIDLERETYEDWLGRPQEIRPALERIVEPEKLKIGWGKLMLVGRRRS